MTGRITPLGVSLLTVAAWAVSLAVLSARPELDKREQKTLLAPMAAALPWLLEE